MSDLVCFKAYDIRGILGEQINGEIAYRIARSFAKVLKARKVVIGRDIRNSSESLRNSVVRGLMHEGVKVFDLGLCGTEEMYFATNYCKADGGIEITASHNPINYNGMKLVGFRARPLNSENEFSLIKKMAEKNIFAKNGFGSKQMVGKSMRDEYVQKILSFIDCKFPKPLHILVNCGNGTAGKTFEMIERELSERKSPIKFSHIFKKPNGNFPNGIPNPMVKENRKITSDAVILSGADMGIAFDGDFDRCFFFDELGDFINGEYMVALLASIFFNKKKGCRVVHDPRNTWNIKNVAMQNNGKLIQSRTGHAYVKQAMRENDAVYGGEMSAHHYFKDFSYCDSGMIPWLLIAELLSHGKTKMSQLVDQYRLDFPSSGEINFELKNILKGLEAVKYHYKDSERSEDNTDGISYEFKNWRLNLRASNTEPLVRLNVETNKNREYLNKKVKEVISILEKSNL